MSTSKRADRVWKRLIEAYGSRVAENYGRDIPKSWVDAIEDLNDEQVTYGLRKVVRDSPIHPPALGQFEAACIDMPQAQTQKGPNIQEQLCAYATLKLHPKVELGELPAWSFSRPWTYVYREWIDEARPKHMQKCAECIGVVIDLDEGNRIGWSVEMMRGDREGHTKALKSFEPGKPPTREQRRNWMDVTAEHAQKLRGESA